MELTSKQRAQLRGLANNIDTILIVGKDGIGDNLVKQANDALEARELIKGRVLENSMLSPREAAQELARRGLRPDVICVDPPRKGISPEVVEAIVQMAPQRVVYVSCDPATLGRDVKRLREGGYLLQQAEAVDLFPRTGHVETVCLLSKLNTERHVEVELNLKGLD